MFVWLIKSYISPTQVSIEESSQVHSMQVISLANF